VAGHRREIAIDKAPSDFHRPAECGVSRGGITLHNAGDADGDQQIAADDAVELTLLQQAPGSCEPAGRGSDRAPLHERKTQPERGSSGPFTVSAIEEGLMRASGDALALLIPAHQVGRNREALEVLGVERCVTIGGSQQTIRFGPRPLVERLPPTPQGGEVRHVTFRTVDRTGSRVSTTLWCVRNMACIDLLPQKPRSLKSNRGDGRERAFFETVWTVPQSWR
jgi:hypothetical protein